MNNEQLTDLLRKANTQRDAAEEALADYKNNTYKAVAAMYYNALDMFDTADIMPDFITELAEAFNVSTAFTCPACEKLRPFELGSGDCQTCEDCCKCTDYGTYCWPYYNRCIHEKYSTSPQVCTFHGEYTKCYQRTCNNCNQVIEHALHA